MDDTSSLEILNLLALGLSSINPKFQVPSDIPPEESYLPPQNFETQANLNKINKWTEDHEMLLNPKKSKYMVINFCNSYQFRTRLYIKNSLIEQVRQTRLLGVIISDDLTWSANTQDFIKRAYKRFVILRKLNEFSVSKRDMITIYILFIRSILEQSSVVWSSSLTKDEKNAFERTQKVALRIIYQEDYISYENALKLSNLKTIEERHTKLLLNFAIKCSKNVNTKNMLPLAPSKPWARKQDKYQVPFARKERFFRSAIPTMARMLNGSSQ